MIRDVRLSHSLEFTPNFYHVVITQFVVALVNAINITRSRKKTLLTLHIYTHTIFRIIGINQTRNYTFTHTQYLELLG